MHPYSLDNSVRQYVYVGIAVIAILAPQYIEQLRVIFGLSEVYAVTVSFGLIYGILFFIIDKYAWKLLTYIDLIPNLNGNWKAKGKSSYKDEDGEPFTYDMDVKIKQTLTKLEVYTITKDSISKSKMASIELDNAQAILKYTFENVPKNMSNDELQRHPGLVELQIETNDKMSGDYFSGKHRLRYGELNLERIK